MSRSGFHRFKHVRNGVVITGLLFLATFVYAETGLSEAPPAPHPTDVSGFVKKESACPGKWVDGFTDEDAGDSVRGEPEHVVFEKHPLVQSASFSRCVTYDKNEGGVEPNRIGIEQVLLKDGSVIVVKNTGWEYVTLSYTFIFPEESHDIQDPPFWFHKAVSSMALANTLSRDYTGEDSVMAGGPMGNEPIAHDLSENAKEGFLTLIKSGEPLKIKDPIDLHRGEINDYTWIERVGELTANKGRYLEIVISRGPL